MVTSFHLYFSGLFEQCWGAPPFVPQVWKTFSASFLSPSLREKDSSYRPTTHIPRRDPTDPKMILDAMDSPLAPSEEKRVRAPGDKPRGFGKVCVCGGGVSGWDLNCKHSPILLQDPGFGERLLPLPREEKGTLMVIWGTLEIVRPWLLLLCP